MTQMHRIIEHKYADTLVTFYNTLEICAEDIQTTRSSLFHEQFATVFEGNMLGWDLHFYRDPIDSPWTLKMWQTTIRDIGPPPETIQFTLKLLNSDGTVNESLQYEIDEQTIDGRIAIESLGIFQSDPNSGFGKDLSKLITSVEQKERKLEFVTKCVYDRNDFVDLKYLVAKGAPIETEASESNFDAITAKFPKNLKLITSDGTQFVMTNNEMVCLASGYFRAFLTEHTTKLTVECSDVEAINICLIYMVTRHYKKPAQLTPRLASQISALAEQWFTYPDLEKLRSSLEKHLCLELQTNHEDLSYVCNLMIIAEDNEFVNVKLRCIATIVSYHAHDFIRTMVNSRHPLSQRLSTRGEGQDESLAEQTIDAYYQSLKAKPFINIISDD